MYKLRQRKASRLVQQLQAQGLAVGIDTIGMSNSERALYGRLFRAELKLVGVLQRFEGMLGPSVQREENTRNIEFHLRGKRDVDKEVILGKLNSQ